MGDQPAIARHARPLSNKKKKKKKKRGRLTSSGEACLSSHLQACLDYGCMQVQRIILCDWQRNTYYNKLKVRLLEIQYYGTQKLFSFMNF